MQSTFVEVDPSLAEKLVNLPTMVAGVNSNNVQMQLEATMQFRKLLSEEQQSPIDEVGISRAGVAARWLATCSGDAARCLGVNNVCSVGVETASMYHDRSRVYSFDTASPSRAHGRDGHGRGGKEHAHSHSHGGHGHAH